MEPTNVVIFNEDRKSQVNQFSKYAVVFFISAVLFALNWGPDKYDIYMVARIGIFFTTSIYYYDIYKKQLELNNPNDFRLHEGFFEITINMSKFLLITAGVTVVLYFYLGYNLRRNPDAIFTDIEAIPLHHTIRSIIVSPVWEELLFRGIFYNLFFKGGTRRDNVLYLLTSSLLFTLIHSQLPNLQTLFYFVISMSLGGLYLWTKNIKYPMFLHCFINYMNNPIARYILKLPY